MFVNKKDIVVRRRSFTEELALWVVIMGRWKGCANIENAIYVVILSGMEEVIWGANLYYKVLKQGRMAVVHEGRKTAGIGLSA